MNTSMNNEMDFQEAFIRGVFVRAVYCGYASTHCLSTQRSLQIIWGVDYGKKIF